MGPTVLAVIHKFDNSWFLYTCTTVKNYSLMTERPGGLYKIVGLNQRNYLTFLWGDNHAKDQESEQ